MSSSRGTWRGDSSGPRSIVAVVFTFRNFKLWELCQSLGLGNLLAWDNSYRMSSGVICEPFLIMEGPGSLRVLGVRMRKVVGRRGPRKLMFEVRYNGSNSKQITAKTELSDRATLRPE